MRLRHLARLSPGSIARQLCCFALVLLQACQPGGPDAPFKRHLSQLELALSVSRPAMRNTPVPRFPAVRELPLSISPGTIAKLDFQRLSGCAVQANIGKRQTSLGQFAKPSQRLLLDLEYLRLAPACIHRLRDANRHALADSLEFARREQQTQLPALIFNATLGSDEYRALWLATPVPSDYPRSATNALSSALEAINGQTANWLNGDYRAHNRDFELLLSVVAGGDGGRRLQDWAHQTDWLTTANLMLEQALGSDMVCREQRSDPTAANRINIANNYFTDVIAALTTQSQRHYLEALAPVSALETQLGVVLPPQYRRWIATRDRHVAPLVHAPRKHLRLLGRIQQACRRG